MAREIRYELFKEYEDFETFRFAMQQQGYTESSQKIASALGVTRETLIRHLKSDPDLTYCKYQEDNFDGTRKKERYLYFRASDIEAWLDRTATYQAHTKKVACDAASKAYKAYEAYIQDQKKKGIKKPTMATFFFANIEFCKALEEAGILSARLRYFCSPDGRRWYARHRSYFPVVTMPKIENLYAKAAKAAKNKEQSMPLDMLLERGHTRSVHPEMQRREWFSCGYTKITINRTLVLHYTTRLHTPTLVIPAALDETDIYMDRVDLEFKYPFLKNIKLSMEEEEE